MNSGIQRFGGVDWDEMGQIGVLNIILSNNLLSYYNLIIENNNKS